MCPSLMSILVGDCAASQRATPWTAICPRHSGPILERTTGFEPATLTSERPLVEPVTCGNAGTPARCAIRLPCVAGHPWTLVDGARTCRGLTTAAAHALTRPESCHAHGEPG